jgi:tRNA(Ile)-lysidine synthase
MRINDFASKLLETLLYCPPTQCFWVAYSGGLDSHVLLHALTQLHKNKSFPGGVKLRAIHIHHGLHPEADSWAMHCQQVCSVLGVSSEVSRVRVRTGTRESVEANARTARYEAITQLIAPNDVVLTAQHADDQAETLLLQLLRGAGVAGLAAMPPVSRLGQGWLVRPLLAYTRSQLYDYARQANLQWIEDSSNVDTRFDRNFLRHEIIPLLLQRWPSLSNTLSRAARHQAEADELVQTLAAEDLRCVHNEVNPSFLERRGFFDKENSFQRVGPLFIPALSRLSLARQRNVLRFWIKHLGLPLPSTVQLQHILSDMLTAREDRQPMVHWHGGEVRRYRNQLFAMPNLPPIPDSSHTLSWTLPQSRRLPLGELTVNEVQGRGLALPAGTELQVRFRQGGEIFRWRGHRRVVKKLLQAAQLPPWQRPFIPLIYLDNTLVALGNIGIADGFVASDQQMGWEIEFTEYSEFLKF